MKFTRKSKLIAVLGCAVVYTIPLLTIDGAFDIFMKAASITGEYTGPAGDQSGLIKVLGFSIGGSSSSDWQSAGSVNMQDLNVVKLVDSTSPQWFGKMATGTHLTTLEMDVKTTLGQPGMMVRVSLEDVVVTSISWGGSNGGGEITENLSVDFKKITYSYYTVDDKGVFTGPISTFTWDASVVK